MKPDRFNKAFPLIILIGMIVSMPVDAADLNGPVTFSVKQLPAWADEAWTEYRTARSSGQRKEASDLLARVKKQALSAGIRNFDYPAAVLIQEGEEALSKGLLDEAVELARAAKEWSPDDPNTSFFLAKALFYQHPFNPFSAVVEYIHWISAGARDFWFAFHGLGRLILILSAGLLGGFLVFFSVAMIRNFPLLVHSLHELLSVALNRTAVWFLVVSLLLMPLFLGLGIGFVLIMGLCLVWLYMSRSERLVTTSVLVTFSLGVFWLPFMLSWFTADPSVELMLLSRVMRGDASATGAAGLMEERGGHEKNWPVLLSLAVQKKREGNHVEALERYLQLQKLEPDRSIILNNIGNLYFLMKQYDPAVTYYKQFLTKDSRNAVSHYNLNLVYRELLRFEEAKQEYEAAQQIHMPLIQSLEGRGPIDELFPKKLLWSIAFAKTPLREETSQALFQSVFAPLTLNLSPTLLGLFAVGVIAIRLTVSRKITASGCALCGRPICFHCQRRVLDLKTCDTCWGGSKNVKRKTDLRPLKMRQRRIHQWAQWISVAFPGSGHLYLGRGVRGFIFSGFFIGILFTLLFRNRFFQSPGEPAGILGFVGMTGIITGLVVLYIQVFRDLVKASHEKS